MKTFSLKYGQKFFDLSLPEEDVLGVLDGKPLKSAGTEEEIIRQALENPIGSPRLKDLVKPGETVCVIVSDVTRAWQKMWRYMHFIVEELEAAGIPDADITFLSSTGTHRSQTPEEHALLLGAKLFGRFEVIDHVCTDSESLVRVGTTRYGTPLEFNRIALESDHIVMTGAIVYHFMAGFGGGRKSILPGISGYDTVQANHALALDPVPGKGRNPDVRSGNLVNNVLHMDMIEAVEVVKPTFLFNVVMDGDGNIGRAVAGNWKEAHEAGCAIVDATDGVGVDELAECAVAAAGGYPKDINFYQSSKTIFNGMEAVKKGGSIVILTQCSEGLGNEQVRSMLLDYHNTVEREAELRREFSIAKYVGYVIGYVAEEWDLILVSDIEPEAVEPAGIKVFRDLDCAMAYVRKTHGEHLKTFVMPHGANTLPKLMESE